MRNTSNRTILQALAIFLFKLRILNSNRIIGKMFFGLTYEQQVSDIFNDVMKSFEKDILPNFFGYNCISREQIIFNITHTVRKLLGTGENRLILIFDGTYLRYQKNSNNYYQKKILLWSKESSFMQAIHNLYNKWIHCRYIMIFLWNCK